MLRWGLVALLCATGCLDIPGLGSDDPEADAGPPPDGGSPVFDAGGLDANSCGAPFSLAHVDLIRSRPSGGELSGLALVMAMDVPVALDALQVEEDDYTQFDISLPVASDSTVSPGTGHGGLEQSAATQIKLLIDDAQWKDMAQPVLALSLKSQPTLPATHNLVFAARIDQQRVEFNVRVMYDDAQDGIVAQRAALVESDCIE